jgi:hypothetical protein
VVELWGSPVTANLHYLLYSGTYPEVYNSIGLGCPLMLWRSLFLLARNCM